jgi:hypothetical protein
MNDRRSFLRDGLRWMALGGLAVTGVVLGSRPGSRGPSSACPVEKACRSCLRLGECPQPRANRFREQTSLIRSGELNAGQGGVR